MDLFDLKHTPEYLSGGGVKGGYRDGATGDNGQKPVQDRVSVHDFHAIFLYLPGMNFRDPVYERHRLDERLTDRYPVRLVSEIPV